MTENKRFENLKKLIKMTKLTIMCTTLCECRLSVSAARKIGGKQIGRKADSHSDMSAHL